MATIKLQRTSEYLNRLRDYQIYIDGEKIGHIANGEKKVFETTSGQHSLIAKVDWCSSQEIKLNIDDTQPKELKIGGFKNSNWIMSIGFFLVVLSFVLNRLLDNEWSMFIALPILAILVYYITIGRTKYLTLTELN